MTQTADAPEEAYARTRMLQILGALEEIAESTPYPAVTVRMICERAGISRPTFYRYFKDKDDVVQWYWDQSGEKHLRQMGREQGWYEGNLRMLLEFREHAALMSAVLAHDEGVNSCIKHGYRQRVRYLRELIAGENALALNDDTDFEIRFFADAESRAIAQWVQKGMVEKPEVLARRLEDCVPPRLRRAVRDAAADKQSPHEPSPHSKPTASTPQPE